MTTTVFTLDVMWYDDDGNWLVTDQFEIPGWESTGIPIESVVIRTPLKGSQFKFSLSSIPTAGLDTVALLGYALLTEQLQVEYSTTVYQDNTDGYSYVPVNGLIFYAADTVTPLGENSYTPYVGSVNNLRVSLSGYFSDATDATASIQLSILVDDEPVVFGLYPDTFGSLYADIPINAGALLINEIDVYCTGASGNDFTYLLKVTCEQ